MFVQLGRSQRLFEEQGDTGGTGNGGATAQPEDIARLVNQAVTSQLTRALPKALEGVMANVAKSLDEKLAAFKPSTPVDPQPGQGQPKESPEYVALQRKLDELMAANKAAEDRAQAIERRAREDAAFGDLRGLLSKDIKPEFVDTVAKSLYYADKRVEFGEDGKPLFRTMIPAYQGGPLQETLLPLRDGVEAFVKSKEAEAYRPPPAPKQPQFQQRGPVSRQTSPLAQDGKIPSVMEDPGFAARLAKELEAGGVTSAASVFESE